MFYAKILGSHRVLTTPTWAGNSNWRKALDVGLGFRLLREVQPFDQIGEYLHI